MYRDTDIFQEGGEVSPDLGTIEPIMPGEVQGGFVDYLTRPMVPSPARQRRDFLRGIASFIPGLSYEIAKAERDPLGQGLSLLDVIPGGAVVGASLKKSAKKGIESLAETPKKINTPDSLEDLKAQGFDIENPIHHGSFKDFDKFDESFIGQRDAGFFGRGFYFAKEPSEASYYGPIVKKYYKRGNFLDLTPNKTNSDFELLDKKYFKFWANKLDRLDMLDQPTKKGLDSLNKLDDYLEKNVKIMQATDNRGREGLAAYVKDPTKNDPLERIYSSFGLPDQKTAVKNLREQIIEQTRRDPNLRKIFPGFDDTLFSLSDYIRVGGKGADELTRQAKKAGYDGVKVGDETVVFDAKNIAEAPRPKGVASLKNYRDNFTFEQRQYAVQGGVDKNAKFMYEIAEEANPVFQNEISKIAQKAGLELGVPDARLLDTNQLLRSLDPETGQIAGTVKKVPRIMEKAVTKYDGDVSKITDAIRTRVIVKTPQDEEKILKLLSENFEVLDKGRSVKPSGFVDRKILVKSDSFTETPNTIIGEIALITEPMIQASKKSHPIYKNFRTLFPKGMPTNKKELGKIGDEIRQQGLELDRQMKELFDEAKKEIDPGFYEKVKKFFAGGYVTSGKSGNSAPIAPNLFSNAPLDIFEPSTKKSAIMSGDAKVQSVLPEDIKKPYDPSSTESITAGPSSHVKNNLSINSILQEVTKNYKPDQMNIFDVE